MKRALSLLLLSAGLALAARAAPDPRPVSTVDGAPITVAELSAYLRGYLTKAALDALIDEAMLYLEAERYGLGVTDAEVTRRIEETRRKGGASLQEAIKLAEIDEADWKERVRTLLLAEKIADRKWPVTATDLYRLSVRYARVTTQAQARDLIRQARVSLGRNFEVLVLQHTLDKEFGGMVQPDPFFRIDNPPFFKAAAGMRKGQISPEPIASGGFWLVLRLEEVYPPETLKPAEKERITARIRAARVAGLLPELKKRYRVERVIPLEKLTSGDPPDTGAVIARVQPPAPRGREAEPPTPILYGELTDRLLADYGRGAIDRLVERRLIDNEAARLRVAVSPAELDARIREVQSTLGRLKPGAADASYGAALRSEGLSEEAWRERVRYMLLSEKVQNARSPVKDEELTHYTVRVIRLPNRAQADSALQLLGMGVDFEQLRRARSLDRAGDGLVQPRLFTRMDQPRIVDAIPQDARPGTVLPEPLQLGNSWFILRLEARQEAGQLSPAVRDALLRRINTARLPDLLGSLRKEAEIRPGVPLKSLRGSDADE